MTIQPLTGVLVALVLIFTAATMGTWHYVSGGSWRNYAVGRAFMGLLAVQATIVALALATMVFGQFPGRPWAYVVVYAALVGAQVRIWWTAFTALRHPERLNRKSLRKETVSPSQEFEND